MGSVLVQIYAYTGEPRRPRRPRKSPYGVRNSPGEPRMAPCGFLWLSCDSPVAPCESASVIRRSFASHSPAFALDDIRRSFDGDSPVIHRSFAGHSPVIRRSFAGSFADHSPARFPRRVQETPEEATRAQESPGEPRRAHIGRPIEEMVGMPRGHIPIDIYEMLNNDMKPMP